MTGQILKSIEPSYLDAVYSYMVFEAYEYEKEDEKVSAHVTKGPGSTHRNCKCY